MNLFKLLFALVLVFSITACNDDDEPVCIQADWIGTYSGTIDCDGATEDVAVTITASGSDAVIIAYESTSGAVTLSAEYDPITISECTLSNEASQSGITLKVDASIDAYQLSIQLYKDQNNELNSVQPKLGLAKLYLNLGQLDLALKQTDESLDIAQKYNSLPDLAEVMEVLSKISEKQNHQTQNHLK